jgi:hypothetical protein
MMNAAATPDTTESLLLFMFLHLVPWFTLTTNAW